MRKTIYLDHAATTPVLPEVIEGMTHCLAEIYGNPSAVYRIADQAKEAVRRAREQAAGLIGARPDEIFFTSGGTEADNWALKAAADLHAARRRSAGSGQYAEDHMQGKAHIITCRTEHHAVLRTCEYLEKTGRAEITYVDVDRDGRVCPSDIEHATRPDTVLISIMTANNETGTLQPVQEIAAAAKRHNILFHTDAVQAAGHIPLDVRELQADLISVSGHKFGGPKGTGFLYIRKGIQLESLLHGGEQERGRRAGTENVPGIAGFGIAAKAAADSLREHMKQEIRMRKELIRSMRELIPDCILNGPEEERLPGNVNLSFPGVPAEFILTALDMKGICASAGSACSAGLPDPSHVLMAMGRSREEAFQSVRFSLSWQNTAEDIRQAAACTAEAVRKYRGTGLK